MSLYPPCQYIRLMFKITVTALAQYLKHISEMLEKQQHSFPQPPCPPGKAPPPQGNDKSVTENGNKSKVSGLDLLPTIYPI